MVLTFAQMKFSLKQLIYSYCFWKLFVCVFAVAGIHFWLCSRNDIFVFVEFLSINSVVNSIHVWSSLAVTLDSDYLSIKSCKLT